MTSVNAEDARLDRYIEATGDGDLGTLLSAIRDVRLATQRLNDDYEAERSADTWALGYIDGRDAACDQIIYALGVGLSDAIARLEGEANDA